MKKLCGFEENFEMILESSGQHNVKIGSFCVQNDQILFESFQRFLGLIIYDFINTICYYGGGGQCVCILKLPTQ